MMRWNSTKTYTEEDIIKMQQEAVNRVHDFQQRAQKYSYYDVPIIGDTYPGPPIEAESRVIDSPQSVKQPIVPQQSSPPSSGPLPGLFDNLNLDSETLLILGLLYLLYTEKADNLLLVALAYLLF